MLLVLDSNIFDKLDVDKLTRDLLAEAISLARTEVLMPDMVERELQDHPKFRGVPDWFPTTSRPDSVFVLGHSEEERLENPKLFAGSRLGHARLGHGEVYTEHMGDSRKIPDATIVDFADTEGAVLVSEDKRLIRRALKQGVEALQYKEFACRLRDMD